MSMRFTDNCTICGEQYAATQYSLQASYEVGESDVHRICILNQSDSVIVFLHAE